MCLYIQLSWALDSCNYKRFFHVFECLTEHSIIMQSPGLFFIVQVV